MLSCIPAVATAQLNWPQDLPRPDVLLAAQPAGCCMLCATCCSVPLRLISRKAAHHDQLQSCRLAQYLAVCRLQQGSSAGTKRSSEQMVSDLRAKVALQGSLRPVPLTKDHRPGEPSEKGLHLSSICQPCLQLAEVQASLPAHCMVRLASSPRAELCVAVAGSH